jgi:hypothetical protein
MHTRTRNSTRTLRLMFAASLGAVLGMAGAVRAQHNFLTNGDFTQGLQGWTVVGFADSPLVQSYDVTGRGASSAFGCNPGNNQLPFLSLQQTVLALPGTGTEFFANLAMESPGANASGGIVEVHIGPDLIARHDFGAATPGIRRVALCGRILPTVGGNQTLSITFSRPFLGLLGRTPRVWIDDMELTLSPGPSFTIDGSRRPNEQVTLRTQGDPNDLFAVFVAGSRLPTGITLPPFNGTWWLGPTGIAALWSGRLDAGGLATLPITLPNDPGMSGVPLWFQAAGASATLVTFGNAHDLGLH